MAWLFLLAIPPVLLILAYFLPVGVIINYNADGANIKAYIGPVKLQLYPGSGESKVAVESVEKTDSKRRKENGVQTAGGAIKTFLAYVRFAVKILDELRTKIVIKHLHLKIIQGGSDPFELAMRHGGSCIAAANLLALIDESFVVKKKTVFMDCDFLETQTRVLAKVNLSISLGKLLRLYAMFTKMYNNEFNRILIIKKAVQTNESESS